jgi:hypothetical protein
MSRDSIREYRRKSGLPDELADYTVKIWDPAFGDQAITQRSDAWLSSVVFDPSGRRIYTNNKSVVLIFDPDGRPADEEAIKAFDNANVAWHRRQAQDCLQCIALDAAMFHLQQLERLQPGAALNRSLLTPNGTRFDRNLYQPQCVSTRFSRYFLVNRTLTRIG